MLVDDSLKKSKIGLFNFQILNIILWIFFLVEQVVGM